MRKLILTSFLLFTSVGILFASGCDSHDYADINKLTPEIVLTSNNIQLLKYSDYEGTTRFTIKNLDGTILAENMSRIELIIDFPEIEKEFES